MSIHQNVFVHRSAVIEGDVEIGKNSSVWPCAVIRGDNSKIIIGEFSNVQDNATIHGDPGQDVIIGDYVSIGHNTIVHSATIKDNCIIGMGAILLNNCVIEKNCLIGAGAVVTENKIIPEGSLVVGVPGKVIRKLTEEEIKNLRKNAETYISLAKERK